MQLFARFFSPFLQLFAGQFNETEICKSFSIDWRLYLTMAGRVHTDVREPTDVRTEEATDCTGTGKSVQQSEKSVSPVGKRRWTTEQPSIILKVLE